VSERQALQAATLVTQAATLKYKLIAMALAATLFLAFLITLGLIGANGAAQAFAESCGDTGLPGVAAPGAGPSPAPSGSALAQQLANAKTIDQVAQQGGLSGQATLIALMTAEQESTLLNLDHGDADSLGLFQQRPSEGWGTAAQILTPSYAARAFFFGAGTNKGLTGIPGWATMDPGAAAQAVQHSEYGQLYDGQQQAAETIAQEAGIDLTRPGTGASQNPTATASGGASTTNCYPEATPSAGAGFHDGNSPWPSNVLNPRSSAEAVTWAEAEASNSVGGWYAQCLRFVANAYGYSGSGWTNPPADTDAYAIQLYENIIPVSMRHNGDRNPPIGALMFWKTGNVAGHVALYVGNGNIASTDIERPGYVDIVPATDIESKWGGTYIGWAPPYFPNGG